MASDADRLRWIMEYCEFDGIHGLKMDRHEYASYEAETHGRDEPNAEDELDGFRRMIDAAINKYT